MAGIALGHGCRMMANNEPRTGRVFPGGSPWYSVNLRRRKVPGVAPLRRTRMLAAMIARSLVALHPIWVVLWERTCPVEVSRPRRVHSPEPNGLSWSDPTECKAWQATEMRRWNLPLV